MWGYTLGADHYYIARLNEDMISLAEEPKMVEIENGWQNDACWISKFGGVYYLNRLRRRFFSRRGGRILHGRGCKHRRRRRGRRRFRRPRPSRSLPLPLSAGATIRSWKASARRSGTLFPSAPWSPIIWRDRRRSARRGSSSPRRPTAFRRKRFGKGLGKCMYKIAVMGEYDSIYGFATLGLDTFPVSGTRT